ncbi:hypothetical protein K439DRAFT_1662405 [Ramaria rubella]|nr:hypothetical protein K439DRAFT_1662405 [Ramaria rubella]
MSVNEYHLGMVNPPRKVKRLAFKESSAPSSSTISISNIQLPSSVPRAPSPTASPTAAKRRGRKPAGAMSKSAREQLRKTNHSVIEKRRREKINEALATLRELVPNDKQETEKREDKEFKLEILVRTVEYLKIVLAQIKDMEGGKCQGCGGALSLATMQSKSSPADRVSRTAVKRKRTEYEDEGVGDEPDTLNDDLVQTQAHTPPRSSSKAPEDHARLPSISSWMPDSDTQSHTFQLPSPPQTTLFPPTAAPTVFLPKLVLPSPIGPVIPSDTRHLSHQSSETNAEHNFRSPSSSPGLVSMSRDPDVPERPLNLDTPYHTSRPCGRLQQRPLALSSGRSSNTKQISSISSFVTLPQEPSDPHARPLWSRDEETAASLLLDFSSRRSRSGSSSSTSAEERWDSGNRGISDNLPRPRHVAFEAQTPSSVLGMPGDRNSRDL